MWCLEPMYSFVNVRLTVHSYFRIGPCIYISNLDQYDFIIIFVIMGIISACR